MLLTQSLIAENLYMRLRVAACAAAEGVTDVGIEPDAWSKQWSKVWAATEGWDTKWEDAQKNGNKDKGVNAHLPPGATPIGIPSNHMADDIGMDPEVITDEMIQDKIRSMKPFTMIEENKPEANPMMMASREFVSQMLEPTNRTISAVKVALEEVKGEEVLVPPPPSESDRERLRTEERQARETAKIEVEQEEAAKSEGKK